MSCHDYFGICGVFKAPDIAQMVFFTSPHDLNALHHGKVVNTVCSVCLNAPLMHSKDEMGVLHSISGRKSGKHRKIFTDSSLASVSRLTWCSLTLVNTVEGTRTSRDELIIECMYFECNCVVYFVLRDTCSRRHDYGGEIAQSTIVLESRL